MTEAILCVVFAILGAGAAGATGFVPPIYGIIAGISLGWAVARGWRPSMPNRSTFADSDGLAGFVALPFAIVFFAVIMAILSTFMPSFADAIARMDRAGGFWTKLVTFKWDKIFLFWLVATPTVAGMCLMWAFKSGKGVPAFLTAVMVVTGFSILFPGITSAATTFGGRVKDAITNTCVGVGGNTSPINNRKNSSVTIPNEIFRESIRYGQLPQLVLPLEGSVESASITLAMFVGESKVPRPVKLTIYRELQPVYGDNGLPVKGFSAQIFMGRKAVVYHDDEMTGSGANRRPIQLSPPMKAALEDNSVKAYNLTLAERKGFGRVLTGDPARGSTPQNILIEGEIRIVPTW